MNIYNEEYWKKYNDKKKKRLGIDYIQLLGSIFIL